MKRRTFLLAAVAVTAPRAGEAQQAGGRVHIGWLSSGASPVAEQTAGFKEALAQMGYEVDRKLFVDERFASGDSDRLRKHALDLVRKNVHAIVAFGTPASLAAKEATDSIPVIMLAVGDPVGSGLVRSLSKPGGNVTGVSAAFADVATKYVELLKQLAPAIARIAFLGNAENPVNIRTVFPAVQGAGRSLGIAVEYFSAAKPEDVSVTLASVTRLGMQGLIVSADAVIRSRALEITEFATRNRLPAVYFANDYVRTGGLLSYGPNPRGLGRRAG